ncbi:hypothetical protein [Streptomyces caniscabiei]|uniref:hypothetical protein n=1 Tax=Streptomyces caniscabiei TaxID=2746961 RepID=UPI001180B8A1|nr:hypothetical protein [Streptomyces caniscabiei]
MHLRQVTACTGPADYTTHRRRRPTLAWRIYTCRRHRSLFGWSVPGNLRRLADNEEHPSCGTVHDHRPDAEIIVSHLHGWMSASGTPSDSPEPSEDDWRAHLHHARATFVATGQAGLQAVIDRALLLAETGGGHDILTLLATAETKDAQQRRI